MDQKGKRDMLHHYAGNCMLKARFKLRKGESSDPYRINLIEKLKNLGEDSMVEQCVNFLENTDWSIPENINAFQKYYNQMK